jgi:hypothetical protein
LRTDLLRTPVEILREFFVIELRIQRRMIK